ncbi:hypothetical protein K7X08_017925 [Anisodus acutangulus]|uniref:Probable purine permease n=1 Tax=Anisodus acutangulus TaxID=402998 RepID=A0A9Q1R914_9SOLA|nr:hypothetical protein K7X08_017925 [Anisodus acutangulus]
MVPIKAIEYIRKVQFSPSTSDDCSGLKVEEVEGSETCENAKTSSLESSKFILWFQIFIFTIFVLAGQVVGTLLGRVYYEQGGHSRWIATLAQTAGFPILLPFICYPSSKNHNEQEELSVQQPSIFVRASNETGVSGEVSHKSLLIGFTAATFGSLGYALQFSLTELAFQKVFKSGTLKVVMKMSFFIGFFVTIASLTGLFASGNWRDLDKEMGEYRSGKLSYVINLVCTAISWQLYAVGSIGLVFKASSLFSNVIINLGTSVVPIFSMVFLKDIMTGLKVLSLLLGLWGYASYIYQHYLDDVEAKAAEVKSLADDDEF